MDIIIYTCPYCTEVGGKNLGEDKNGVPTCTICGKRNGNNEIVHFPEYEWNPSIPFNKRKKNNEKNSDKT